MVLAWNARRLFRRKIKVYYSMWLNLALLLFDCEYKKINFIDKIDHPCSDCGVKCLTNHVSLSGRCTHYRMLSLLPATLHDGLLDSLDLEQTAFIYNSQGQFTCSSLVSQASRDDGTVTRYRSGGLDILQAQWWNNNLACSKHFFNLRIVSHYFHVHVHEYTWALHI